MPGEKVLILSPDYNCFFSSVRNNGCEVLETSLIRGHEGTGARGLENSLEAESNLVPPHLRTTVPPTFSIDWDDFEAKCSDEKTTVFLLCNPHNPTGRVWTKEELERMNDICLKHNVKVVSDEIHCELMLRSRLTSQVSRLQISSFLTPHGVAASIVPSTSTRCAT